MDETKAKKVLKLEFLKELPEELVNSKVLENKEELTVDDKGEIFFTHGYWLQTEKGMVSMVKLINYLASELAVTKVDLWLQTQLPKK